MICERASVVSPLVHLNGTAGAALLEQNLSAYATIKAAIVALNQSAPHSRDYYAKANNDYQDARNQHTARLQKLEEIKAELEHVIGAIHDQL